MLVVGLSLPNVGKPTLSVRASFNFIECQVVDQDVRTTSLVEIESKPLHRLVVFIKTPKQEISYLRVLPLFRQPLVQKTEAIAASAIPKSDVLITTSGNLASS